MQQTDVKTKNLVATGAAGIGRCRIKGIYYVGGAGAGSVSLKDGGASGTELIKLDTAASALPFALDLLGEGVLFQGDPYLTLTAATSVTVIYA